MKKIAMLLSLIFFIAGPVYAKDYVITKKAGEFDLSVTMDRNPPIIGDNLVSITIKDAAGAAVTDANVSLEYSMPPMPGMPPGRNMTIVPFKDGVYKTVINLNMSGSWNLVVKIVKAGKSSTAKFTVDAK